MPRKLFQAGNPGRPKGSKNKPKPFEENLIAAIDAVWGEKDYKRLARIVLDAMENEVMVESADGQTMAKKIIYNFEPLKIILPIVARKRPETAEHTGRDGGKIIIEVVHLAGNTDKSNPA